MVARAMQGSANAVAQKADYVDLINLVFEGAYVEAAQRLVDLDAFRCDDASRSLLRKCTEYLFEAVLLKSGHDGDLLRVACLVSKRLLSQSQGAGGISASECLRSFHRFMLIDVGLEAFTCRQHHKAAKAEAQRTQVEGQILREVASLIKGRIKFWRRVYQATSERLSLKLLALLAAISTVPVSPRVLLLFVDFYSRIGETLTAARLADLLCFSLGLWHLDDLGKANRVSSRSPSWRSLQTLLGDPLGERKIPYPRSLKDLGHFAAYSGHICSKGYRELYQICQPRTLAKIRDLAWGRFRGGRMREDVLRSLRLITIAKALECDRPRHRHGAILARCPCFPGRPEATGEIAGSSTNVAQLYPATSKKDVGIEHAEIGCFVQAIRENGYVRPTAGGEGPQIKRRRIESPESQPKELADLCVYIVELDEYGLGFCDAQACPLCTTALVQTGVPRQHFTTPNGFASQDFSFKPSLT